MNIKDLQHALYNYNNVVRGINSLQDTIDYVEEEGATESHLGAVRFNGNREYDSTNDYDRQQAELRKLKYTLRKYKRIKKQIDEMLEVVKDDNFYRIIPYKYFNKKTHVEIAKNFMIDPSGINRHDKRLLKEMCDYYNLIYGDDSHIIF